MELIPSQVCDIQSELEGRHKEPGHPARGAISMDDGRPREDRYVTLGRQHWDEPLRIHSKHYKRFSRKLERQLERLVRRWSWQAAPNAVRRRTRLAQLWSHLEKLSEDHPENHQADVE